MNFVVNRAIDVDNSMDARNTERTRLSAERSLLGVTIGKEHLLCQRRI